MGRMFTRVLGLLAALILALWAFPSLAVTTFTGTTPSGKTFVITLPPVEEFQEGDHWEGFSAEATAESGMGKVLYSFEKKDGKWAQANMDIDSFIKGNAKTFRDFTDLGNDAPDYPATPREGQLFSATDGVLRQFRSGQWAVVPVGTLLPTPDGNNMNVDRRLLPEETAKIDQAFQHLQAEQDAKAKAEADDAARVQQTPTADPKAAPSTNTTSATNTGSGGAIPLFAVVIILAGAWAWWWFGPRKAAALAKAGQPAPSPAPPTPGDPSDTPAA